MPSKNLLPELMLGQILRHTPAKFPQGLGGLLSEQHLQSELVTVLCLSNQDFRWLYSSKGDLPKVTKITVLFSLELHRALE